MIVSYIFIKDRKAIIIQDQNIIIELFYSSLKIYKLYILLTHIISINLIY